MGLTERRKQFLQKLVEMNKRTRRPVHYETVARELGVSKWTTYDMLTELEKVGYLTRGYAVNPGEPGRSQLVFLPTPAAEEMFSQAAVSPAELSAIRTAVLELLAGARELSPEAAMQLAVRGMAGTEQRAEFCAYALYLVVLHLRLQGGGLEGLVYRTARGAPPTVMRLAVFVSLVMGVGFRSGEVDWDGGLGDLAGRFLRYLGELALQEQEMLVGLLDEMSGSA